MKSVPNTIRRLFQLRGCISIQCRQSLSLFGAVLLLLTFGLSQVVLAGDNGSYISTKKQAHAFPLCVSGVPSTICINSKDYPGIIRVAKQLQDDIRRVTGSTPGLSTDTIPRSHPVVLIGTLDKSPVIDRLVGEKKLDVNGITGKWETFLIQVVDNPMPGVPQALVIAGSDKRGTIYGMYDLAEEIGVSPWNWWADVPAKKQSALYVLPGRHTRGEPKIRYRGIFINDEQPALWGWASEKFGGFNHRFYAHVFELILRLKGNYLWPAMWGRAFYDDDSLNAPLADEYGVVIATSHHEPMMRAHDEWRRYGKGGKWNYEKNDSSLREFWRKGIERMGSYESVVTLAMRGDGDEPMTQEANVALLERIVKDQRQILAEVTGKDVTTIPQVWALYKEVQEYYDKGMRVPDDVTLLLCDDNWGNIRKLPQPNEPPRKGGYGVYYHFDYVGDPRNYKWLNTNQISRVWEQMRLAYEYNARQIWIVNVGDIKPVEFPISFFLDYAWNPELWPAERLPEYTKLWAAQQFGDKYAKEIADILTNYTRFNSRRKPELLAPETYSVVNYREAETVVAEYNTLYEKAKHISGALPSECKDAYYQLVLHPVEACSNLNELYLTVARNRLYARQGRAITNSLARKTRELYAIDSAITYYYNNVLADGKWSHMMDQTHIGYTYWQQPDKNSMPEVREIEVPAEAEMGVAVEGSGGWWPREISVAVLPEFDVYERPSHYIEVFNRGKTPFAYSVQVAKPWVRVDSPSGTIETERRLNISIDWGKVPSGQHRVPITVSGPNNSVVVVQAVIENPASPKRTELAGFVEGNGYVSMEASHFTRAVSSASISWQTIPDLGRTLSAVTPIPVTAPAQTPGGSSPHLEYRVYFFTSGEVKVHAYLSPTLNFHNRELRFAVSFDNEVPQVVNVNVGKTRQNWEKCVANNINIEISTHRLDKPGDHVLKFWMIDPGIVLQKLVIDTGGMKASYLGPPESFRQSTK